VFVSRPEPAAASVLHADLDAFYASVEQRDRPELRGQPVIVGGGVVLAASYEARAFGVRSAMGGRDARRRCPHAVVVEPRMRAYTEASRAVFAIFEDTTPLVEGLSVDEAFLEVGGLRRVVGPPVQIAQTLRDRVRAEVGLPLTVGVARTKFLAKVASGMAKPNGLLVVEPDRELDFLHPLPVERLWGVGPITAAKLADRGIHTVGEVAHLPVRSLVSLLGPHAGRHLHALANSRDPRAVVTGRRRRSIGSQRALGRRTRSWAELDTVLVGLVDRVTRRLRDGDRIGRTLTLRFRFDDFTRATRAAALTPPTAHTPTVLAGARALMADSRDLIESQGLTLLGISIGNLSNDDAVQLGLPFRKATPGTLDATLDDVRERFGADAVTRAVLLGQDQGFEMPMLPD
jgi:DNA polymerase-4